MLLYSDASITAYYKGNSRGILEGLSNSVWIVFGNFVNFCLFDKVTFINCHDQDGNDFRLPSIHLIAPE